MGFLTTASLWPRRTSQTPVHLRESLDVRQLTHLEVHGGKEENCDGGQIGPPRLVKLLNSLCQYQQARAKLHQAWATPSKTLPMKLWSEERKANSWAFRSKQSVRHPDHNSRWSWGSARDWWVLTQTCMPPFRTHARCDPFLWLLIAHNPSSTCDRPGHLLGHLLTYVTLYVWSFLTHREFLMSLFPWLSTSSCLVVTLLWHHWTR